MFLIMVVFSGFCFRRLRLGATGHLVTPINEAVLPAFQDGREGGFNLDRSLGEQTVNFFPAFHPGR